MRTIRHCIYALGLRPKAGSIWYSPSLALRYMFEEAMREREEDEENYDPPRYRGLLILILSWLISCIVIGIILGHNKGR